MKQNFITKSDNSGQRIKIMREDWNKDYHLWKRIKAGQTEAFHELYNLYADTLYSFGRVFTRDSELVKDCIHDLVFDLYKYRKNLADNDNIRNYLFKSLKRKIQTAAQKGSTMVLSDTISTDLEHLDTADDTDNNDEQQAQMAKINRLIDRLPEKQKEILNLKFQLEMPYHEIALVLEISVESVRTSIYRSIKTIREQLDGKDLVFFMLFVNKLLENN